MNATEELLAFMNKAGEQLKQVHDPAVMPLMAQLYNRLKNPRNYIVMAGETSSGKSTLINSMLNQYLLPCSNKPTSGTVVQVFQNAEARELIYSVFNRFKAEEVIINKDVFWQQAQQPSEDVLRMKVELPPAQRQYTGLNVFDTPGFASLVAKHEEVFRDFLPHSDIILFTTTYRNGFDQVSRDFMGVISELNTRYGDSPILLVINRCPPGTKKNDKRVREMVSAAEDALHRKVETFLVDVVEVKDDTIKVKPLPKTEELWQRTSELCNTKERSSRTVLRAKEFLKVILREQQLELEGKIQASQIGAEGIQILQTALDDFSTFKPDAQAILERYLGILERDIPRMFERETSHLKNTITAEIYATNKYLDSRACAGFISAHVAPFGISQMSSQINEHVGEVFDQMDKELNERANIAIATIRGNLDIHKDPQITKLLENLALRLGKKLAGETANGLLRSFGGVGGSAAGLGNLAKTIVSRLGHLFGKTFSREVYTQIGKVFTKRMLASLTICMQVFIDAAAFLWEAHHWQGKLEEKSNEMLDKWMADAQGEFLAENIHEYRMSNLKIFDELDASMRAEIQKSLCDAELDYDACKHQALLQQLAYINQLQAELAHIGE